MDTNDDFGGLKKLGKQHNTLPIAGNENTMNLNPLVLANIQGSSYFKVTLFKLKTYHEVVDEIYYQVKHLEPWERGSRKTSGQTGMCGGVRGVGAGGIVSTAFCLLYKLYTLRLTRKQVNGLLNHSDSPYIRALGFMYIRFTQPPGDLYDWYEEYFLDDEEIDVKAGGGQMMTIGQMSYQFLTKLDWFSTLFPRIPVPIQKQIEKKVELYCRSNGVSLHQLTASTVEVVKRNNYAPGTSTNRNYDEIEASGSYKEQINSSRERNPDGYRDDYKHHGNERSRSTEHRRSDRSRSKDRKHKKKHKHRSRSREEKREKDYSKDRHENSDRHRDRDYNRRY